MAKLVIDEKLVGKRLDEALFSSGAAPSRSKVQSLIKDGAVSVNGKAETSHYKVRLADIIIYQEYTNKPLEVEGQDIPLNIVYEDDDILVINKPAGLVVHPGNGHSDGTLVNALKFHEDNLANEDDPVRPGLVHRIDKDTSGLLVVAKNDAALEYLSSQLADHTMHREYMALVMGLIDEEDGKIDAPSGRDPKSPTKFAVNTHNGREAITFFHVEKRYKENLTLISCRLLTGRTHQIRVHLDYIHHPLVGDPLYGAGNENVYKKGQLLHAYRLTFLHPRTHEEVSFEAPLPDYFSELLATLHEK